VKFADAQYRRRRSALRIRWASNGEVATAGRSAATPEAAHDIAEGWSKKRKPPSLPTETIEPVQIGEVRITCIADLGPRQCRFPFGIPKTPDFYVCAEPIPDGASGLRRFYCQQHADICTRPAP
jgi:hypothetical protein